jgi:hypothetical protein
MNEWIDLREGTGEEGEAALAVASGHYSAWNNRGRPGLRVIEQLNKQKIYPRQALIK